MGSSTSGLLRIVSSTSGMLSKPHQRKVVSKSHLVKTFRYGLLNEFTGIGNW